jgi:outer membrane translocation and assembly module TamA
LTQLVLAANVAYSAHFGTVPFFAFPSLAVPGDEGKEGLGGWSTLRGYYANRFVGKVEMHGTLELRWTAIEVNVLNQNLRTQIVPFVDAGRVFDKIARFSVNDWKVAGGIGLRLIWNLATIISFDVGFSRESTLFYLELGQQF